MCLFLCYCEGTEVCAYHEGCGTKLELAVERSLRVASRDCLAQCSDDWDERHVKFVLIIFRAGADRGDDDHACKLRVRELLEARKTVSHAGRVHARSLDVGGKLGSRDVE